MSRCFPFPPPGYERKVRKENVDLLRKEKHKEKKHKKEKRNKEKRGATEKKEKDRGDGKYREKKGRKDKHGDKKNDREKEKEEKDKYTDKKSVSGEERATQQVEGCKGQNISQIQGSIKLKSITDEKNDEKRVEAMKDSKLAPEAGRKIHDDGRVGNQLVGKRENGRTVRLATNSIGTWGEGMDRTDEKGVGDRQFDRPGLDYEARHIQMNAVVRNVQNAMQNRLEEVPRPMENIENKVDANEKGKEKEVDGQKGDKRKEKDREEKSQGKGKDKDKERSQGRDKSKDKEKTQGRDKNGDKKKRRWKDEHKDRGKSHGRDKDGDKEKDKKVKQTGENRNIENDKLKSSNKTNLSCGHDIYRLHTPKDSDSSAAEGKSRKLVEVEANGILLGNDVRPSKLPGTASFHPSAENGAKSAHFHTSTPSASNNEGPIQSPKLDNKGKRKNGMIEAQLSSIPLTHPPSTVAQAVQVAPVSAKSPHPDSMYLNELLSVPKMEEWCCINDEEWLFSGNNSSQSKKPRMGCSEADKIKLVWAKALQIDSADVCALPYVIPY